MTETRTLKIGGLLAALVAASLIIGFALVSRGDGTVRTVPSSPRSSASQIADPKTEVEQGYVQYWAVYTAALQRLETTQLSQVLAGSALAIVTRQVREQKRLNEPVRISVEHDYTIAITGRGTATVDDKYLNHSVRLDGRTGRPVEKDPNEKVHNSYTLKKVNGSWKITDIISYQ